jgi:hypothetical protein
MALFGFFSSRCLRNSPLNHSIRILIFLSILSQTILIAAATAVVPELQKIYNLNDLSTIPSATEMPTPNEKPALLDVIQVYTPVRVPADATCKSTLMVYSFGWSYDKPFVGMAVLGSDKLELIRDRELYSTCL